MTLCVQDMKEFRRRYLLVLDNSLWHNWNFRLNLLIQEIKLFVGCDGPDNFLSVLQRMSKTESLSVKATVTYILQMEVWFYQCWWNYIVWSTLSRSMRAEDYSTERSQKGKYTLCNIFGSLGGCRERIVKMHFCRFQVLQNLLGCSLWLLTANEYEHNYNCSSLHSRAWQSLIPFGIYKSNVKES